MNNFKSCILTLKLLLKSELFPAGDGKGIIQYLVYRIPMFYLPVWGIGFLLIIISYIGLCLISAEQNIADKIEGIKNNPFTSFFGTYPSAFYIEECDSINYYNLTCWQKVQTDEIRGFSELDNVGKIFSSVKPVSPVAIKVKTKENMSLPFQKGLGLPLSGVLIDNLLIDKIKAEVVYGNVDKIEESIIVSTKGLEIFGWHYFENAKYPDFLSIKIHDRDGYYNNEYIPLPVIVVNNLPYNVLYIISDKQFQLFQSGYYDEEIEGFDLRKIVSTFALNANDFKNIFPDLSEIYPTIIDKNEGVRIILNKPNKRSKIINKLFEKNIYNNQTNLFLGDYVLNTLPVYKAAIFHLNFNALPETTWEKNQVFAIQEFMESKGVHVVGEFVEILSSIFEIQNNLGSLKKGFLGLLICTFLTLMIFCTVIFHNKMHKIGIHLMLGIDELIISLAYFILSILLISFSFLSSLILAYFFVPMGFTLVFASVAVLKLFSSLLLITVVSFLFPITYFLYMYEPSEIIAYKS